MAVKPYYKVNTKTVYKKKKEMRPRSKVFATIGVVILAILIVGTCMVFNIGPMNELSCMYNNVHNPTYSEMIKFINMDLTNFNEYTDEYRCGHFSRDVILNARAEGIQAGFVRIKSDDSNHAIVAFQTTDNGLQFLEPQSDTYFHESRMEHFLETGTYYVKGKDGYISIPILEYRINWFYKI